MIPEHELLEQLVDSDAGLSLPIVQTLFADDDRFLRSVSHMLAAGSIELLDGNNQPIPHHQWHATLTTHLTRPRNSLVVRITDKGIQQTE